MARRLPLLAGILVTGILCGGCGDGSTPTQPTPPPVATTPPPPPPPPPQAQPEPAALASLTLTPSSIASQGSPEGAVMLTAPAPTGNAVVQLSSEDRDVAKVPATVTVPAGSTSATFRIETSTVRSASTVTISATYLGVTKTAPLTVTAPALEPRLTVMSPSRGTDACEITSSGGAVDCEFNASTSSGIVARYLWTMKIGSTEVAFSTPDEQAVVTPTTNCGFLGNGTSEDGRFVMEVSLQLEGRDGARSGFARRNVTVHHNGRCGY